MLKKPLEDCFAFDHECRVLKTDSCEGCRTYKTWRQVYEQQKVCKARAEEHGYTYKIVLPEKVLEEFEKQDAASVGEHRNGTKESEK